MAYQQAPSPPMTPALKEACRRAVHVLLPDGQLLRAGRAALYVMARVGYPGLAWALGLPPLIWAVELGYGLLARHRGLIGPHLFKGEQDPGPLL